MRLLVRATPLTLLDRVLGAGFGALRGLVLLLAVATVVAPHAGGTLARLAAARWVRPGWTVRCNGIKPLLPSEL